MKTTWLLLPTLALASACKTAETGSSATSLDNFTGAASVVNNCSGTNASLAPESAIVAQDEAHKAAVARALTAVPTSLQKSFFEQLKGKIVVGAIPSGCQLAGAQSANELDNAMIGCFKQDGDSIAIHIAEAGADTERNIGHALVRTFGYVVSQVMLSFPSSEGAEPAKAAHLAQLEGNLTIYVNADLTAARKYDMAARIDDSVRENMFAEAFDSYYCSAESQASMRSTFPMTMDHFEQQFASQLDEALMADAGSEGMSLWGRWGWGNGPLRQAFSNWVDWRASGNGLFNVRRWANGGGFIFQRPWFNPLRWDVWHNGYYQPTYYYYP